MSRALQQQHTRGTRSRGGARSATLAPAHVSICVRAVAAAWAAGTGPPWHWAAGTLALFFRPQSAGRTAAQHARLLCSATTLWVCAAGRAPSCMLSRSPFGE